MSGSIWIARRRPIPMAASASRSRGVRNQPRRKSPFRADCEGASRMATSTTATPSSIERHAPERSTRAIAPPVDIYETEKEFVILADIPGVGSDGLEVTAERDTLTIRGRVDRPAEEPD